MFTGTQEPMVRLHSKIKVTKSATSENKIRVHAVINRLNGRRGKFDVININNKCKLIDKEIFTSILKGSPCKLFINHKGFSHGKA